MSRAEALAGPRRQATGPQAPHADVLSGLLGKWGLSRADFGEFLDTPYDLVMEQVRRAVAGGEAAWPFMVRPDLPAIGIEDRLTDPASREAIDARHVIVDQLVHHFILRAVFHMADGEFAERVEIRGPEILDRAIASGRGVFLLNSHFGPGHLVPIVVARLGHRLLGLTATDSYPLLGIDLGARFEPVELAATFRPKALLLAREALRAGGIVHSTGDGYAAVSARKRRFLGRYRPFAEGAGYLCQATGAQCLPVFARSDEFGRLRIEFLEPLDAGSREGDTADFAGRLADAYIPLLEQRWLSDFGNVSPHAIRQFAARATPSP